MLAAAIAVVVLMVLVWLIAGAAHDVSLVDLVWGPAFAIAAWAGFLAADDAGGTVAPLVLACVTAWGLRLGIHLARRNLGHGEDPRYAAMRKKRPDTFWVRSLVMIFGVQGALVLIVGWPVVQAAQSDEALSALGVLGLVVFAVGLFFEAVGDWQLTQFKADPASKGQVMDRGLWRYSRHPNYFGDACGWWGLWILSLDAGVTPLTIIGPIVMTTLLLRVSGVALLEKSIGSRRPGYEEYVRRTSAFIPLPPKKA